jgi:hypothetical protein
MFAGVGGKKEKAPLTADQLQQQKLFRAQYRVKHRVHRSIYQKNYYQKNGPTNELTGYAARQFTDENYDVPLGNFRAMDTECWTALGAFLAEYEAANAGDDGNDDGDNNDEVCW